MQCHMSWIHCQWRFLVLSPISTQPPAIVCFTLALLLPVGPFDCAAWARIGMQLNLDGFSLEQLALTLPPKPLRLEEFASLFGRKERGD